MQTQTFVGTLMIEECCNCGVVFGMSQETYRKFRDIHENFCCPYGHKQHYTGKSDSELLAEERRNKEILKSQLKATQDSCDYYAEQSKNHQNALRATKGVVTKLRKRSSAGMCQCCNRYFKNVHDHYKTKHPEYNDGN
jgi:hypothetical protein